MHAAAYVEYIRGHEVEEFWKVDVRVTASVAVVAKILLRSPRKLISFSIKKHIYRIKVYKQETKLVLEKVSLVIAHGQAFEHRHG